MVDPRISKLADVLVNYSVSVEPGQTCLIQVPLPAAPLASEVARAVYQAGGIPSVRIIPDDLQEVALTYASDDQLKTTDPFALYEAEHADCRVAAWSASNTKSLSGFDAKKLALLQQARRPIMEQTMKRSAEGTHEWVGTLYPTPAHAQDAEMGTKAYENFVFRAGLLDKDDPAAAWVQLGKAQQRLCDHLAELIDKGKTEYRVQAGNGTDLTMDIAGMKWINCDGKANFPDGEVFTGPVQGTASGTIKYSFPAVYMSRECDGVELTFRDGRVVDAKASKGEEFLHAMLDQDEGARQIGEVAIGTNYGITEFTKNTLFDEKIGGTVHFAVGEAYPETNAQNKSGLHWDMVCDLRDRAGGGTITLGGEVISKDGRFVNENFPQPRA